MDITCDSDGMIDQYVDGVGVETTLPMPEFSPNETCYMGFFLVGAYQEILGDLHNLFGDTHSADISLDVITSYSIHYTKLYELGEWLASQYGLQVTFIDIDNPA